MKHEFTSHKELLKITNSVELCHMDFGRTIGNNKTLRITIDNHDCVAAACVDRLVSYIDCVVAEILQPEGGVVALAAHRAAFEQRYCTPRLTGGAPWICTWKSALRVWPDLPRTLPGSCGISNRNKGLCACGCSGRTATPG